MSRSWLPLHGKFPRFLAAVVLFVAAAGAVRAQSPSVSLREDAQYRYLTANGIPGHAHGQFPNAGNPNTISEQKYNFRVPLHPRLNGAPAGYGHDLFGVALNGVPFDPGTAEFWNGDPGSGWNYEALSGKINLGIDQSNAHVQPNGAYHYHGVPLGALKRGAAAELVGYAADGFPVYYDPRLKSSYRLKKGTRPSGPGGNYDGTFTQDYEFAEGSGDLDACNGREEKAADGSGETYRYYLTDKFPFVPRCLRGMPDPSFHKAEPHTAPGRGPGRGRQGGAGEGRRPPPGRGARPPQEAVQACAGSREGSPCSFEAPHGTVTGTCRELQGITACMPQGGPPE